MGLGDSCTHGVDVRSVADCRTPDRKRVQVRAAQLFINSIRLSCFGVCRHFSSFCP